MLNSHPKNRKQALCGSLCPGLNSDLNHKTDFIEIAGVSKLVIFLQIFFSLGLFRSWCEQLDIDSAHGIRSVKNDKCDIYLRPGSTPSNSVHCRYSLAVTRSLSY